MKLLTKEILSKTPALHTGGKDKLITAKLFTPDSGWTWFIAEYNPTTQEAYGFVNGHYGEWGYFNLAEIEALRGPLGLRVERDLSFTPKRASEMNFSNA